MMACANIFICIEAKPLSNVNMAGPDPHLHGTSSHLPAWDLPSSVKYFPVQRDENN